MKVSRGRARIGSEVKVTKTVISEPKLWKKAQRRAKKLGLSVSAYICKLIENDLENQK